MVEVMFTTAPLFASAIAAKSGSAWIGAPEGCTPAGDGALAPCEACAGGCGCGSDLEQPPAINAAASKETASIPGFIGSLASSRMGLRWAQAACRSTLLKKDPDAYEASAARNSAGFTMRN